MITHLECWFYPEKSYRLIKNIFILVHHIFLLTVFDLVSLVYRLYPVDKSRVNEYGQSFDDDGGTQPQTEGDNSKQKTE